MSIEREYRRHAARASKWLQHVQVVDFNHVAPVLLDRPQRESEVAAAFLRGPQGHIERECARVAPLWVVGSGNSAGRIPEILRVSVSS